jgi:starch synthase (maltosyl-transferring)
MRLVLAATLSPSYGIYSGFELCEHEAVPSTEEYLHSEKYEIKVRDWRAPGNIVDFVARVNAVRHENPALHALTNVRFLPTDSEHLLAYAKRDAHGANVLLVVVNLDPHAAHEGTVQVPPEAIGAAVPGVQPTEGYAAHDLLTGARYNWGAFNYVRLEPQVEPAHIFRVEARSP